MDVCWRELAATPPVSTMPSPPPSHTSASSAGGATGIMAGIGKRFLLHLILVLSTIFIFVSFYILSAMSMRRYLTVFTSFTTLYLQRPRLLLTQVCSEPALLSPLLPKPCFPPPTTTLVTLVVQCEPVAVV